MIRLVRTIAALAIVGTGVSSANAATTKVPDSWVKSCKVSGHNNGWGTYIWTGKSLDGAKKTLAVALIGQKTGANGNARLSGNTLTMGGHTFTITRYDTQPQKDGTYLVCLNFHTEG